MCVCVCVYVYIIYTRTNIHTCRFANAPSGQETCFWPNVVMITTSVVFLCIPRFNRLQDYFDALAACFIALDVLGCTACWKHSSNLSGPPVC